MAHPRLTQADPLICSLTDEQLSQYRLPAEWEPLSAVLLCPPHNKDTWPGCLEQAQAQFAVFEDAVRHFANVVTLDDWDIQSTDSWIRDYGPITVVRKPNANSADLSPALIHDFRFNSWGGKYDNPDIDDVIPQWLAFAQNLPVMLHDFVLEGGGIETDGQGTLLVTESCLLNPSRNANMSREQVEHELKRLLGIQQIIWLPGGTLSGDDTDGHIDNLVRFIRPGVVICIVPDAHHPDATVGRANLEALQQARDAQGKPLKIIQLPAPAPLWFNYPGDRFTEPRKAMLPASYANFLIANKAVFVPTFGQAYDDVALDKISNVMPRHTIVPVRAEWLVVGQGGLHCLSMQQPKF